jgi:hypothetical protein
VIENNGKKGIRLCKEDYIICCSESETCKSVARLPRQNTSVCVCNAEV